MGAERQIGYVPPPFDRVELTEGDMRTSLAYEDFIALELSVRIRLILTGQPQFWRSGEIIPRSEALAL